MESRIKKLERNGSQQGFFLLILMVVLLIDTAGILLLWQQEGAPQFDHIAVSLTVFQIMFAVAAVYGFWALRGLTIEKSEEVAEREFKKIAPPLIARLMQENLQAMGVDTISEDNVRQMVDAIAQAGEEGENGK